MRRVGDRCPILFVAGLCFFALLFPGDAVSQEAPPLTDPDHPAFSEPAPDHFRVLIQTDEGPFTIAVHRHWAPHGADRFYNLVRHGYYDDARFHRVVPGFIVQFGLAGDPTLSRAWRRAYIPDDRVVVSNTRGRIAFAFTDPETRATQVYINLADNSRLDAGGFAPFGEVVHGMFTVDDLYGGYGEDSGGGLRRGDQSRILEGGNAYLDREYPELSTLIRARILP